LSRVFPTEVRVAAPQFPGRVHSDLARLILGEIPDASYDRRIRAVATPGKCISAKDFSALQAFLEKAPADDPETPDRLDAIKNDVAAKLLPCEHFPDGFSRRFLSMLSNPNVGLVWQNYMIQFLDSLWVRETDPAARKKIVAALVDATSDERLTISGTALLTLRRLEKFGKHVVDSQRDVLSLRSALSGARGVGISTIPDLEKLAMSMLDDQRIPWQEKITTLHVAADSAHSRAFVFARSLASDKTSPVMFRMAAFSVIGDIGNAGDKPLLEKHAKGGEFRLRHAAKAALKRLEKR
jgi:hypothetical protein